LTPLTLLTVPEDPTLSIYLRTRETTDRSLEKRMSQATTQVAAAPKIARCSDNIASGARPSQQELDLDKFMAALTASVAPDAVIKTIVSAMDASHPHKSANNRW